MTGGADPGGYLSTAFILLSHIVFFTTQEMGALAAGINKLLIIKLSVFTCSFKDKNITTRFS